MIYTILLSINIILSVSDDIECYDSWECQSQELSGSVLCYGYQSCESSSITSDKEIPCTGHKSCMNSKIRSTDSIACTGDYACSNAQLSTDDTLRCHGNSGCYGSDIDAVNVIADGVESLKAATIDSVHHDNINIYSHGYLSGINSNVICRSGSECNVYCEGNGCQDLNFGCLSGSKCSVSPSYCTDSTTNKDENKDANEVEPEVETEPSDNCPKWYLSDSKEMDDAILTKLDRQRLDAIQKMEFDDFNTDFIHLLDPLKYMHDEDGKQKELKLDSYDGVPGETDKDLNGGTDQQVLSSNIHATGSITDKNEEIGIGLMVCCIIMIGIGSWHCLYNKTRCNTTSGRGEYSQFDGEESTVISDTDLINSSQSQQSCKGQTILCYALYILVIIALCITSGYELFGGVRHVTTSSTHNDIVQIGSKGINSVSDVDTTDSDPYVITSIMTKQVINCAESDDDVTCDNKFGCYTYQDDIIAVINAFNTRWDEFEEYVELKVGVKLDYYKGCFGESLDEDVFCVDKCEDQGIAYLNKDNPTICKNTFLDKMRDGTKLKPYRRSCIASLLAYQWAASGLCNKPEGISVAIELAAFNWWKQAYLVSDVWSHNECPYYV